MYFAVRKNGLWHSSARSAGLGDWTIGMNVPPLNPDELPASRIVPADVLYERLQKHTRVVRGRTVVDVDAASPPSVKEQGRRTGASAGDGSGPPSDTRAPSLPTFTPPHDDEDDGPTSDPASSCRSGSCSISRYFFKYSLIF